ncbi:hypothetical protein D3C81_1370770 [compost metagenome]
MLLEAADIAAAHLDVGEVVGHVQLVADGIAGAEQVEGLQLADIVLVAVVVHLILCGQRSEVAGIQFETFDLAAGGQEALDAFRQQAAVVGGQHRQVDELLAVFQGGAGDARLHRSAGAGEGVLGATVAAGLHVERAGAALAAVQLDAGQAEGVDAEADGALGEARFVDGMQAEAGFFGIARRIGGFAAAITGAVAGVDVHVHRAAQYGQAAVLDQALGFGLLAGKGQLGAAGGHGEGDEVPFHGHGDSSR